MRSRFPAFLHAMACVGFSIASASASFAQAPSKANSDRARVATADVQAIAKALETASTSAAPLVSSASCTPGWVPTFGPQAGVDGAVWSALQHDDGSGNALYIGGEFRSAGAIESPGLVRWDGASFSRVGAWPEYVVRAFAVFDDGAGAQLYAAGHAFGATGQTQGIVARWDGASWTAIGGTIDGPVMTLRVFDGGAGARLWAGGLFTTVGGVAAAQLATWDGQTWSSTGASFHPEVRALAIHDDGSGAQLYVGGGFSLAGGAPGNRVARFDGQSWSDVGDPSILGSVWTLESFDDGFGPALWAGGDLPHPLGSATRVLRWRGGQWWQASVLNGTQRVHAFHVYDDVGGPTLFAVGRFDVVLGVAVHNVMRWYPLGDAFGHAYTGFNGPANALARFDSPDGPRLFAGGEFTAAGTYIQPSVAPRLALLDGSLWSWPDSSPAARVAALGEYSDGAGAALVAHGLFPVEGGDDLFQGVVRREGDRWRALGVPLLTAPSALHTHDDGSGPKLYAAGPNLLSWNWVNFGPVARYDGMAWSTVGSPSLNARVNALETFDDGSGPALYAGGAFTPSTGPWLMRVAKWDGQQWLPVGIGLPQFSEVLDFAVHDDGSGPALYAGGTSSGAGAQVAKWDGASWISVGQDTTAATTVTSLASFDDGSGAQLYASGFLLTAWDAPVNIARWDTQVWSALPGDLLGSPTRLVAHDDGAGEKLYVAGVFGLAGGAQDIQLARFDGAQWEVLGEGLGGLEMQLLEYDDGCGPALAFAGFDGMEPSSGDGYLARWGCPACGDALTYCVAGTSSAGCVAELQAAGVASASDPANFTVLARSVEGDRLGALIYGINGPLSAPFGASTLCVAPPLQLTRVQSSSSSAGNCDGVLAEDWNQFRATHPGALGAPFGVGDTVWAQFWLRDPSSANTLVTSGAIQFSLAP